MKKALAFISLILVSALTLAGKDVPCKIWTGKTDGLHMPVSLKVAKSADGTVAGTLSFKDDEYTVFGDGRWQTDEEYVLTLFQAGGEVGEFNGIIDDRGRILGTLKAHGYDECVHLSCQNSTMPDPFEHPSLDEVENFSVFYHTAETPTEIMGGGIVLCKGENGFAFYVIKHNADGFGTVRNFESQEWFVLPYKDGKIVYKTDIEGIEIEIFRDFIIARPLEQEEESETSSAYAQGVYLRTASSDSFDPGWLFIDGEGDGDGYTAEDDGPEYLPLDRYTDVIALSYIIINGKADGLRIPVAVGQGQKPNIDTYFRAVAKAFDGGILGEALKAASGRRPEFQDTKWTLDIPHGYAKAEVPYRSGEEGMEMCYFKGKDGADVVAMCLTYAAVCATNIYDECQMFLGVFFRFDPETKTLQILSTTGSANNDLYSCGERYAMSPLNDLMQVNCIKLPREGKTIEYQDFGGDPLITCTWNADTQWFEWTWRKDGIE